MQSPRPSLRTTERSGVGSNPRRYGTTIVAHLHVIPYTINRCQAELVEASPAVTQGIASRSYLAIRNYRAGWAE